MTDDAAPTTLDKLPLRSGGSIVGIDWDRLSERDARRLPVEKLHKGPFGVDPIACRIGRMTVALRSAQAAAIAVGPLKSK